MLYFVHQHDIIHPCQLTLSPGGSSAAVCSVGQDSRDLWRWLMASCVASRTALIRSSVILPPYRFCMPQFTRKITVLCMRCVCRANLPRQTLHLRDWSQQLQMSGGQYAVHGKKKSFSILMYIHKCKIISEIVLNSVLFNDKSLSALTSKTVAIIFTGTQSSSSRGVTPWARWGLFCRILEH